MTIKSYGKLFALTVLLVMFHRVEAEPYFSVGAGYKLSEKINTDCYWANKEASKCFGTKSHPLTARIEIGYEWHNVRAGITHHSQWLQGWPVNGDKKEYAKNEIFVDYVWRWK